MKTFTNCAEKKAKQFLNLLQGYNKGIRLIAILVLLLMGVSNAWSWNTLYLASSHNGWNSNTYGLGNSSTGTGVFYSYTPIDMDFKIIHAGTTWLGRDYGDKLKPGDDGFNFDKNKSSNCRYNGDAGIIGFHCDQTGSGGADDWPWIWLTRPTIKIKHWWGGSDNNWTAYNMEDNQNGTYSYIGYYSGHNQTNIGIEGSDATLKYIENAKLEGLNAKTGNKKCLFTYNSNGYIGHGTASQNTGSLTITRLYTIKYDGNGSTTGVPSDHDKKHGTNTTLSSSIPTRTGYTFAGWNTKQDGTGTTYAKGATYSTNADVTLYAKWTANTYTVTFNKQSGTGGTNSVTATYNAAMPSATMPTRTGYTFNGYFDATSGGTKYYNANGTSARTWNKAANTTLYAQWTENKYNVDISIDGNGTTNQTGTKSIGIKGISITATPEIGSAFKQWEVTGGAKVANATSATTTITATSAGTVKAIFEAQPATTIYLEPTGHWNSDKAVFQAHVWQTGKTGRNLDMVGIGDPSHADGDNKSPHRYYKVEVPYGYDKILFFRKDNFATANENAWNKTGDLTIPIDNNTLYVITDNTTSPAKGTWKAPNFIYTITLGYCDFGTYGIKYNGQSYFSKPSENVTIDVPAGAQIEILEGQPLSNAYTGDVIKSKPTKEELTGQTLTINGDITLDDNFKTKERHVVYLGVLETLDNWQLENNQTYYIWRYDSKGSISMTAADEGSYVFTKDGIKYYRFTIAAGCNSYRFERKDKDSFTGTTHACSEWLDFQIPLTDVNCFTLKDEKDDKNRYKGTWGVLPALPGDYRLLYVEQVVEKSKKAGDEWKPVITRKKAHPSNIIRKGTARQIVSLHTYKDRKYTANLGGELTYESSNNPEIILQRCTGFVDGKSQWEDVECQMVYGPLETLPIMANLPGRKNASSNSNIDDLQHQDGIENIKNDDHPDQGNGVWNFVVTQDNNGNASVQWNETHRYEGEYYIRTDNAEGGWDQYTLNDNYMTYSQYAKDHSGFSHYFCRWVEKNITPNTKFVIANDHGVAISDTLSGDQFTDIHGNIQEDANIRWSWNMVTNEIARAYIQGTWDVKTSKRKRNLVVNYKSSSTAYDQEALLDDSGDWIYQKDFTVKVGSHLNSLTAQYPVTTGPTQTFAENLDMLTGNPANDNDYKVRVLYDFKINKTLVALVPDNGKQADIAIDVIIERVDQKPATQVQAQVNATRTEGSTVYAVMSFTKGHITGSASKYAKQFYWISFPFDVRVSDVFGFGKYGKHWIIQWYDGAERAKYGCWIDSPTYWRFQTDTTNYVLEAGKGYVLTLDLAEMDVFTNTNQVSLYFPSRNTVKTVDGEIIHELNTTTLAPYTCTIQRNDRYIKDSHWHMLGVPSYANKNKSFTQNNVAFFYQYNSADDTYTPTSSGTFNFNSMFSYMVQFAGTINWSQFTFAANGSQGLAAKRNTDNANDKHVLRLELQKNNTSVDQTFVQLQAEGATEMFDMNLDLTKMVNSGNNIYSLIPGTESNIEVAANAMPIAETIIPLGVVSAAAGEYTFAMPEGTDGIVVELIDYETNTRTNMLLDEYTVNLGKGTFENRFALHVKPNKTTTSLEDVNTNTTGVKKYLIDGVLYMQKDGVLYDAQGKLVR